MTLNNSAVHEVPWTAQNQTRALIAKLQLGQVQTLRTMHLTLGAFSLALTLLTVHRIISDARRVAAVKVTPKKRRFYLLENVHPAETFPLALACGAVIQQIIFVAVQSTSLHSVLSTKCRGLAMVTFPALFIVGYITLVFGFEMALRAFRYERFAPRGKWSVSICMGVFSFLVILTWIPTVVWPMFPRCMGSLIWFPMRYELISIVILSILTFFFFLLAALISIQLMRTSDIDPNERIAASRMCYYLLVAALVYVLVLPVEIQAHRRDFLNTLATSRIAEISLFSSGIVIAFIHLFLRVNATRMVIKPVGETTAAPKTKRPRIRFFGPSDLEMNISGPLALQGGRRPDSRQGLIDVGPEKNRYEFDADYFTRPEKMTPLSPGSMQSQGPIDPSKWPLPPDPIQTTYFAEPKDGSTGLHKRSKSSYSLFPTRAEEIPRLPATVYSPQKSSNLAARRQTRRSSLADAKSVTDVSEAFNWLAAPPPLFTGRPHRRDESTDSSATVQIGLRFSVAPAAIAAANCTAINRAMSPAIPGAPPLRRDNSDLSSSESLGLPIQSPSSKSSSTDILSDDPSSISIPSSLNFPEPPRLTSPTKTGLGKTPVFPVLAKEVGPSDVQTARDKSLPPTPRSAYPSPPPASQPPLRPGIVSGLRMNPVSPASPPRSATTRSPTSARSPISTRSPTVPSPTARIPLGAGTMARSPPPNGWI
ncbi:uncharacterized protein BDR25DRAFT_223566 [Lindgomyces ingoldianus]|uniref:Uncharacterized protein n=1 Tax=Lindgomyces ingoldianus TaxID=673940 RepID=A0ACB6QW82_9PLEO|nr:uncharacterized protein BDR25DRAFT_223566 [Lindgomyces ingoldianus]KAF2471135.1 hypothetical protein BDR25DRAFT_223566 [Lindgomyces ingoldianus]